MTTSLRRIKRRHDAAAPTRRRRALWNAKVRAFIALSQQLLDASAQATEAQLLADWPTDV